MSITWLNLVQVIHQSHASASMLNAHYLLAPKVLPISLIQHSMLAQNNINSRNLPSGRSARMQHQSCSSHISTPMSSQSSVLIIHVIFITISTSRRWGALECNGKYCIKHGPFSGPMSRTLTNSSLPPILWSATIVGSAQLDLEWGRKQEKM